jgi:hypothetical protein
MLHHPTVERLHELRLFGMAAALADQQSQNSKASAADVATRGEFFYSFSSSVVKPFRRLRIDSPDSVSRCAL